MIRTSEDSQSGFTIIETMISIIILGGGLLALALAFAQGLVTMSTSHSHQIAKEKAAEAIESVTTSRDTRVITWAQIRNVSRGGIFLDGAIQMRAPGTDGLVNTADDGALEPGLDDFTREIEIRDLAPNLRQIRVIVSYRIGHLQRQYQLISYVSSFA
ncbi:MAG: prepilin-type N-terminal cleavage/methylation domain-containing protein [Acidobacteria bacterium]|nr:prepilin-type N-terminal cleavage/methylation domain-containing protein [Acidobacteriota bacterium]